MDRSSIITRCGVLHIALLVACTATALFALQPPTAEQAKQYERDGTLAARLSRAFRLGNNRIDPLLAIRMRQRLRPMGMSTTAVEWPPVPEHIVYALPSGRQGGLPAKGSPKTLVLLVEFPDYPHTVNQTPSDVMSKFFGDGDLSRYPYESLRNYYQRSSYGQLSIQGNVLGWYMAQHERSFYESDNEALGREVLIMEALDFFDTHGSGHDFTQYDNDSDGTIDSLYLKWTGPDAGWSSFWWSYQSGWGVDPDYRIDGRAVGKYVWSWISSPAGNAYQAKTDIHETGHLLGLPDLYDYNDAVGPPGGVGGLDIMASNWGDHNCLSKFMLEWLTPKIISSGSQNLTLNPSGTSQDCVLIMPGASPDAVFGEFFMVQYRKRYTGNDPADYPADGYLIWHVDSTLDSSGSIFLFNNSYTDHKFLRLMEADGLEEIEQKRSVDSGDFYLPPSTFDNATTPNSRNYAGAPTGVEVDQLTSPGASMSARFTVTPWPIVIAEGSALVEESCEPANRVLDPGEVVTVDFSLQDIASVNTTNLRATLLPSGGITSPSKPQDYGVLEATGPIVTRPFSFLVEADCGDILTATLELHDGEIALDPVTFTFRTGEEVYAFRDGFDEVFPPDIPSEWSTAVIPGGVNSWMTSSVMSDSEPNAIVVIPGAVSDTWLDSPPIAITSSTARLTFRQGYAITDDVSGAVLEIALGQAAFQDILESGGMFVSGGYSDGVVVGNGNPLAGRRIWTGFVPEFTTVIVDLPAEAAGQEIRLRWRLSQYDPDSLTGLFLDSVSISEGYHCCTTPPSIGDFDGDGDADAEDFGCLQRCLSGPDQAQYAPDCRAARMDADADVDQDDLALFIRCHTPAGIPADPNCRHD